MNNVSQHNWQKQVETDIAAITPILETLGFSLEADQPHLKGERFLMQAVTTAAGQKLILLGSREADNTRVVIKVALDDAGVAELKHEHHCRRILHKINFAYNTFSSPTELLYKKRSGYLFSITAFIDQKCSFLERPTPEQFSFALAAFKAQESAHATTSKHRRTIAKTFPLRSKKTYLSNQTEFINTVRVALPQETTLFTTLTSVQREILADKSVLAQYGDFLTHTDFVPHNFRIKDGRVYLLDHSSLTFGNKYEGWARFINFMTLYNPELAAALLRYVSDNRSDGEGEALRLMRLYRLSEIICYYTGTLARSEGNLLKLNQARIAFWHQVLTCVLVNQIVPTGFITDYQTLRDSLRSEDEKERQKGLH